MSAKGDNFMAQLTMDKLVALAKTADSSIPEVKSTAVFPTLGTTALSAFNSKTTSSRLGGRNLWLKIPITSDLTAQ